MGDSSPHGLRSELRKVGALMRASWLTAASYRLRLVLSFGGLLASFIPLYFVAEALQPMAAESIRDEGERYFGFLVVGLAVTAYIDFAMGSIKNTISSGISTGTLEALLATPTRLPVLLSGMTGYGFIRTTIQGILFLGAIVAVGTPIAWSGLPLAALIVLLIVLAYLSVGLVAAALHLVFRTSGPVVSATLALSTLLGGVYYSTTVIPEVIQPLAAVVPLTYGLRALRQVLLSDATVPMVAGDVAILAAFAAVLLTGGILAFRGGLRYARRAGTLAQY